MRVCNAFSVDEDDLSAVGLSEFDLLNCALHSRVFVIVHRDFPKSAVAQSFSRHPVFQTVRF